MTVQYQGVWSLQSAAQLQSTQRWVTDPLFENTTLLLQADDAANGAQNNTFLDSSSNNFAITRNGNTTQGTFSPFSVQPGAWSNSFDGTGDYITAAGANLALGTGNFTIEFWFYANAYSSAVDSAFMFDSRSGNNTSGFFIGPVFNNTQTLHVGQNTSPIITANTTYPLNTWIHCAVVRSSGTITLYQNGVNVGSVANTTNNTATTNYIGSGWWLPSGSGQMFNGYLSNLRISNTARYTANFNPSANVFVSDGNTVLLTCQSNRFVDGSSNGYTITVGGGTPSVQAFSPFAPQFQWTPSVIGGSGYFDGTGDYLTAAGNAAFAFGTGDFTVAAWIYPTVVSTFTVLSSNYNYSSGSGNWSLYFGVGSAQSLFFNSGSGNKQSTVTTTIPLNAWTHVAYTRVGTTGRFFVNGAQLGGTISDSFNYGGSSGNLFVGQQNDGTGLANGYMTSIQVLKGTGYSSLPLPTTPATNITNTSLLLNFNNAGIYDGAMKNNLETTGNVAINTNIVKYGSGSLFFDGSGDYLTMPNVQQIVGVMNPINTLTIECWVFPTARPAFNESGLIGDMSPTAGTNYWSFGPNSNGYLFWYAYQSASQTATSTFIPLNTWTHIAVSIQTGRIRLFVNGILQAFTGDAALTITSGSVGYLTMGQWNNSTNYAYTGYVDDLRITRGVARYITSFTPPTVALPRQ